MSKRRHELTDEQWQRLEPLLPPQKPKTGHPNLDHRIILNGIIWLFRTGAPWSDLPERYGKWQTVVGRFYRWQKAGIWQQVFAELQQAGAADGQLDWEGHYGDGSIVRAHQHAAGAKKVQRKRKHWVVVRGVQHQNPLESRRRWQADDVCADCRGTSCVKRR